MKQQEVIRVLIVEDDSAVAAGIAGLLESYGLATHVIGVGRDALPAVETFRPDVVVLDVHLPDVSGDGVFHDLRSRWPDLPVIFSSGHVRDLSDVVEGTPHRVELLRKPYQGQQLMDAIRRVTR